MIEEWRTAIVARLLVFPRRAKMLLAATADGGCGVVALLIALLLLGPQPVWYESVGPFGGYTAALIIVALAAPAVAGAAGTYQSVTRYMHNTVLWRVVLSAATLFAVLMLLCAALGRAAQTWNHLVVFTLVLALAMTFWRMAAAWLLGGSRPESRGAPVAIYGAGDAGRQLAAALAGGQQFRPVAFLDDNPQFHGRVLSGLRVYAPADVERLKRRGIKRVLLALPSATRQRRKQILESLGQHALQVLVMPALDELAEGKRRVDELREVRIEDLLGRDPVKPDAELMRAFTAGQCVLVTGGGGSIGAELARQVLGQGVRKLIVLDMSEYALYEIERALRKLRQKGAGDVSTEIVAVLGSVLDRDLLQRVMRLHKVDTIYHAAAYKHVPLVQANAAAGIRNNLFGTRCAVEAAAECGVKHFVLVSTDKAVRPANIMGASKRAAELVVQRVAQQHSGMRVAIVRFGNVLASSGSVIPLFKQQLAEGGPITVTHPEVTRYFMTIPEAAELVIQAGAMGRHGEIFLLEMGEPVKIVDLARRLIRLAGHIPGDPATGTEGHIGIRYTGLRPGEKMIEELLVDGSSTPTGHPRIFRADDEGIAHSVLARFLAALEENLDQGHHQQAAEAILKLAKGQPAAVVSPPRQEHVVNLSPTGS